MSHQCTLWCFNVLLFWRHVNGTACLKLIILIPIYKQDTRGSSNKDFTGKQCLIIISHIIFLFTYESLGNDDGFQNFLYTANGLQPSALTENLFCNLEILLSCTKEMPNIIKKKKEKSMTSKIKKTNFFVFWRPEPFMQIIFSVHNQINYGIKSY